MYIFKVFRLLRSVSTPFAIPFPSFDPYLPCGLFHPYQLDESISHLRDVWCILFFFILFISDGTS